MMINTSLHLIFSQDAWLKASSLIEADDQVLFLQDAVYLLSQRDLELNSKHVYARHLDITARNIIPMATITVIDDNKWVELTTTAHNILSW